MSENLFSMQAANALAAGRSLPNVRRVETLREGKKVAEEFEAVPGQGVSATVEGRRILVGTTAFLAQAGVATGELEWRSAKLAEDGRTPIVAARDGQPLGIQARVAGDGDF